MSSLKPAFWAALSVAVATFGCNEAPPEEKSPRPVRTEAVESREASTGLRYSASIQPYEQVSVAFKVGGYVSEVQERKGLDGRVRYLQQGDQVLRGAILARVQEADYREQVNAARGRVGEAQASLTKAELDFGRAERLYESQSLTRPDYDAAKAALEAARARISSAAAQLSSAEISLRDCALAAPIDGVVLSRSIEPGVLASPGTPAFVLADVRRVKVVFGVPDHVAGRLETGDSVAFSTDTAGADNHGLVTAISPSADPQSRVFAVELTVANGDGRLKPGMIAAVELDPLNVAGEAPSPDVPTVPLAAVVQAGSEGGDYAVFVVESTEGRDVARLRPVGLGPISGNRISVVAGLGPKDRVIVSGATLLVDGEPVRVIP